MELEKLKLLGLWPVWGAEGEGDPEPDPDPDPEPDPEPTAEELKAENDRLKKEAEKNQRSLVKARADYKAANKRAKRALSDEDQAEFDRLKEQAAELEDKEVMEKGDLEQAVEHRLKGVREQHAREIADRDNSIADLNRDLNEAIIESSIRAAANSEISKGLRETAIDDVVENSQRADWEGRRWTRKEKKPVLVEDDGETPVLGSDGNPMSQAEWIRELGERRPHYYEDSKGAGAPGGSGDKSRGDRAPTNLIRSEMSDEQVAEYVGNWGREKYLALPYKRAPTAA